MKVLLLLLFFGTGSLAQLGGFLPKLNKNEKEGGSGSGLTIPNLSNVAGSVRNAVSNNFEKFNGLNIKDFGDFLAETGKKYSTEAEKTLREGVFKQSLEKINKHNADFASGKSLYELGVNPFSDLKLDEIVGRLTGRKKSSDGDKTAKLHKRRSSPPASIAIPDSFDWREKGGVTPVKFQGLECGACWSFAATGAIEGHSFAKTGKLTTLSEQNLIDCATEVPYGSQGCDGGFQEYAFAYVAANKGIAAGEKYPYVEETGKQCLYNDTIKSASIEAFESITPGDEVKMKEIIATKGPLACSVHAEVDSFVLYKSGIYEDKDCNNGELDHSILVVGYGTENGRDYWIIKNTWTENWGEKGYMKLPRNEKSFCGIADECSFPIV